MNSHPVPLVLVTHTLPSGWLAQLENKYRLAVGPENATTLSPDLINQLPEADGLFSLLTIKIDEEILSQAPRLKVISNMAVGVDNIDISACTRRGIPVGHTPGVLTDGTADLTMAILLAIARRIPESSQDAREGKWHTWSPTGWLGKDLKGATLGIVGLGKIGKAVAMRAKGFGMKLIYYDHTSCPEIEEQLGISAVSLMDLFKKSDFISLHVPLNSETRGLVNLNRLRAMKPEAILINTSRGPVVDTEALYQVLRDHQIGGAALDVTDPEPLPPTHPLFKLDNCLIVPHIGSATWNTRKSMAEVACENLIAGLDNKNLPFCANPEAYANR
jgi:glyoxylate reductase